MGLQWQGMKSVAPWTMALLLISLILSQIRPRPADHPVPSPSSKSSAVRPNTPHPQDPSRFDIEHNLLRGTPALPSGNANQHNDNEHIPDNRAAHYTLDGEVLQSQVSRAFLVPSGCALCHAPMRASCRLVCNLIFIF